ncbi:proteasome assembly chaperone family protein [archaeon]
MNSTEVIIENEARLEKPVLIEGLPGLGLVGKLAADHMIKELKAEKLATMHSPHFPPQVLIQDDGTVRMMQNDFYYWQAEKKAQKDLLFIVGDHQGSTPVSHYEITGKTLDIAEMYGSDLVYTLGGFATGHLPRKPKVFGAVTSKKLQKKLRTAGVTFEKTGGGIVGAAGLLLGMGKLRGMEGVCLMGETHGQIIDARSAKAVLEVLQKLLKVDVNLSRLEKRAKDTEKMIEKARKAEQQQKAAFNALPSEGPTYIR